MCIFVLSRVLIYEFHYDYVKNEYGNNSRQLFTVTDSLMYEIKTNDVSEDFGTNKELFDFGNYFANWKYYEWNKLIVGKLYCHYQRIYWIEAKDLFSLCGW